MKKWMILAALAACGGGDDEETCDPTIVGDICTIAGSGKSGYSGDGGRARDAKMSLPQDTLMAPDGTLYVLDWNNHRVRSLGSDGILRHVVGRGELGGSLDDPANSDLNHPTALLLRDDAQTLLVAVVAVRAVARDGADRARSGGITGLGGGLRTAVAAACSETERVERDE